MIDREDFVVRISKAIAGGRHKIGQPITKEEAVKRATLIADALPGLFT